MSPFANQGAVLDPPQAIDEGVRCPLPLMPAKVHALSSDLCDTLERAGCFLAPSVQEHLSFEKLLGDLSAEFVNLSGDQVDAQIETALRTLVEFLDVDRGGLAEVLIEQGQLVITHSYNRPSAPQQSRTVLTHELPWYAGMIYRGEVLRLRRLPDELPPEASAEREYCTRIGMKSHVMIPLKVTGSVVGAIGFAAFRAHRDWPDDLVHRLRLVGEIFTNALARKRADQALKKFEEQARELRDELAHATRLELVSHLTVSIAHEVNQPLCAIASNAQSALNLLQMGEMEEAKHALQDIWSDAKRGSEWIGRVRNMVKKEEPSRLPTNLASIIDEVMPLLRREAAARAVELKSENHRDDLIVVCDRVQLQQVLLNLVLNAVEVVSEVSVGPPEVLIRVMDDQHSAHVLVEDSGVGLSAEDCQRVFAPFFTTKTKGLGMGLPISRSIITSHGGSLWATRRGSHGSVFHFRLPATFGNQP
jgi:signal transduction histidine kinase